MTPDETSLGAMLTDFANVWVGFVMARTYAIASAVLSRTRVKGLSETAIVVAIMAAVLTITVWGLGIDFRLRPFIAGFAIAGLAAKYGNQLGERQSWSTTRKGEGETGVGGC